MLYDLLVKAGAKSLARTEVEGALIDLEERAEALPVQAPLPAVARILAARLHDADDPASVIATLDAEELWLACACGAGDEAAVRVADDRYIAPLRAGLAHMKLDDATLEDVLQAVRQKLFLPSDKGSTRLEDYAGEGRLGNLVRVVAVRTALDRIRSDGRRPDAPAREPAEVLLEAALAPDLRLHKQRHREAFKAAFQGAVAELSPRQRGVLRLHLLDRLSIDDIGALHDVNRSSAARWLKEIRTALGKTTRRTLRAELKLSQEDLESLFRAADSQLDLSFSRILTD